MVTEFKSGQMVPSMKESGETTKPTVSGNSGMLTVMYTKANGKMTKQMAKERIFMLMEPNMQANGRMIYKMAMESRVGQTDLSMKEFTVKA